MPTAQYAISAHTEVPARMSTFASTCGWTVGSITGGVTLRRALAPDTDMSLTDLVTWKVTTITTAGSQADRVEARKAIVVKADKMGIDPTSDPAGADEYLVVDMPRLNGRAFLPDMPTPTKLHCFGDGTFLGFVIEFGYNQFRHIYLGSVDRNGTYKGGDCASVTDVENPAGAQTYDTMPAFCPLFRSAWNRRTAGVTFKGKRGGIYVGGANDGPAWRRMDLGSLPIVLADRQTRTAFGGFGDGPDDLLVSHGFADFSGEQLLFPIYLFAHVLSGLDTRFRPLGAARGVRNVNMKNLEPGQLVTVGNFLWRVFPALAKNGLLSIAPGPFLGTGANGDFTNTAYPAAESSLTIGHAYLVGPAV